MRISQVVVKNFRSLKDLTVNFHSYTCLVGPNGSGKSAIIKSLNLFFHQGPDGPDSRHNVTAEDFHRKNTAEPIRLEITFTDLSTAAIDDLKHYVRNEELRIVTEIRLNQEDGKPVFSQHGIRMGMEEFKAFFVAEKEGARVPELRAMYATLRATYTELPSVSTKAAMMQALQSYESDRPHLCKPMQSDDKFYGFTSGKDRLDKYIQWVFVPAVKDATTEESETRNTALGQLLQRTIRASINFSDDIRNLRDNARKGFQEILDQQQSVLDSVSESLNKRIATWAHPDASLRVEWQEDPDRSVRIDDPLASIVAGEGIFEGGIGRFGHGLQRSFLLALLQELAYLGDTGPTLVIACEEPELYQHPPQASYLATLLRKLAVEGDQVIVATHAPVFVAPDEPETVRLCRIDRSTSATRIAQTSVVEITKLHGKILGRQPEALSGSRAKTHAALQESISEMFFAHRVVLVEGYEDHAFIETYLNLLKLKDEFRRLGCHIVPCNGKSYMIRPLIVCRQLGIPVVTVFDTDADKPDTSGSRIKHKKDNLAILKLCNMDAHDPLPTDTVWGESVVGWYSDIGGVVRAEMGEEEWDKIKAVCEAEFGSVGGLKKNPMFVAEVVTQAWYEGMRSSSLDRICRLITDPELNLAS